MKCNCLGQVRSSSHLKYLAMQDGLAQGSLCS